MKLTWMCLCVHVQPACCMRGLKAMQNVIMCDAPCCIGHHEQMAEVTHLGLLVWCEEEQQQQVGLLLSSFIGENQMSDCTRIHEHSLKIND